ncbi:hypothetical protein [Roseibacillus persicicus]|uniref:hypothetical protein n=1 Tax=Roseibacillus persicicus TaxID=454148 RepID=UPI00280CA9AE|nr:hypothetical protein [Roseibacillus persicicus]MDQ8192352.1 hypothetical protein [Roseibacillus persicicus]
MNNTKTINERLTRIQNNTPRLPAQEPEICTESKASSLDEYEVSNLNKSEKTGLGAIGHMALGRQSLKTSLGAAKIVQQYKLERLQIESDALKTELVSFYRAKSANTAEMMNTFLQKHLMGEEVNRMENLNATLARAAEIFNQSLLELEEKPFADAVKERVAERLFSTYESTCERIQNDILMSKYGA